MEELNQALRKYHQSPEELQSFFIGMLINYEQFDRALPLLSLECTNANFKPSNEWQLKKLLYFAYIKFRISSVTSGKNNLAVVIETIRKNEINIQQENQKFFLSYAATLYRTISDFSSILALVSLYGERDFSNVKDCFFTIELMRAEIATSGRFSEEHKKLLAQMSEQHKHNSTFCITVLLHKLDLRLMYNELCTEEARRIKSSIENDKIPPTHQQYFSFLSAMIEMLGLKNNDQAIHFFDQALITCGWLTMKQAAYFWKKEISYDLISTWENVLLHCAPTFSIESYLAGNRFMKELPSTLPPLYRDFISQSSSSPADEACWIISRNNFQIAGYKSYSTKEKFIDLYSGILSDGKKITLLTDLRVKVLRTVIAFGKEGAHQSLLIDVLFEGSFYYYDSARLRLKNLIVEINKLGIKIKRKNNVYIYDHEKNSLVIIFPVNHQFTGPLAYLAKNYSQFTRKTIEIALNIKPSTASLYLKKWKDQGLITKDPEQKYGEFSLNSRH